MVKTKERVKVILDLEYAPCHKQCMLTFAYPRRSFIPIRTGIRLGFSCRRSCGIDEMSTDQRE